MVTTLSCSKGQMMSGTRFELVSHSLGELPDGTQTITVTVSCHGCLTTETRPLLARGYKAGTKKLLEVAKHLMFYMATNGLLFMPLDRIDQSQKESVLPSKREC